MMVIFICPRCQERVYTNPRVGDVVHDCSVSPVLALSQEDVSDFHTSFTDSEGVVTQNKGPQEAMWSGVVNELQGTIGGIEGEDVEERNARGKKVSIWRTRTHYQYIIVPNKNY